MRAGRTECRGRAYALNLREPEPARSADARGIAGGERHIRLAQAVDHEIGVT
jgi:hypothetical protein